MKRLAYIIAQTVLFKYVVRFLDRIDHEHPNTLRVLTYHRVDNLESRPYLVPRNVSATPDRFRQQMTFFKTHYNPVSLQQVLEFFEHKTDLPERSVLITFDDAYCDFEQNAWPILRDLSIPVTLFVPTAYPNSPHSYFWWDQLYNALCNTKQTHVESPIGQFSLATKKQRLRAFEALNHYVAQQPHEEVMNLVNAFCKQLRVSVLAEDYILSWDSLRKLAVEGVTLAAHTRTHPRLNRIAPHKARLEAAQSWADLQREIGGVPRVFAYPWGVYTEEVVRGLGADGFVLAFTTNRGVNYLDSADPLLLKRISVEFQKSLPMLQLQLLSSIQLK